tara:strand:- start:1068 stop:2168 length:1101 start_codon:yes stop_codon:yes gene_type:complete
MPDATDHSASRYFDGDRPVSQQVEVSINAAAGLLELTLPDDRVIRWPLREVRRLPDTAGGDMALLRWPGDPVARLELGDRSVLRALSRAHRSAPPKGRGRLAGWAVAAVAAVALQIGVLVPLLADNLARFIPPAGERALGEATFGHIRSALDQSGLNPVPLCDAAAGTAALHRLADTLTAGLEVPQDITVSVLDHEMVNAFALPGGFVVLFRGLIDKAQSPDEVAAVLAHEIGHVASSDPTRHALRSAGSIGVLGLLLGDFAGGAAVLFMAERLISAQYSQGAEAGADEFAHVALAKAGISPAALGDMFEHMRDDGGDHDGVVAHFLSHPTLGARIDAARAAVNPSTRYEAALSADDWTALRAICK